MSTRAEKVVIGLILQGVTAAAFVVAQRWSRAHVGAPAWLACNLDADLPLVPEAVWLYVSWYAAPVVILLTDHACFRRAALAIGLSFFACMAGWVAVPATIPRPTIDCDAGWSLAMLCSVYRLDPPTNLFPSFHAALAGVLVWTPLPGRASRLAVSIWMTAICASCFLIKQHFVADVAAGAAVGLAAMATARYALGVFERPGQRRATTTAPRTIATTARTSQRDRALRVS